jgi:hypothetical protein
VGGGRQSQVSPPQPQGIGGLHGVGGIPVGSDGGSAPRGRFWSTADDLGSFRGGVVTLGAWGSSDGGVARRTELASSPTRGQRAFLACQRGQLPWWRRWCVSRTG